MTTAILQDDRGGGKSLLEVATKVHRDTLQELTEFLKEMEIDDDPTTRP